MRKVESILYEDGDYVLITQGIYKGMVGIVSYHEAVGQNVYCTIPQLDNGYSMEEEFSLGTLKYLTDKQAEKLLKDAPFLRVESLDDALRINDGYLEVGCQTITFSDANKIADFIKKHCKVIKKVANVKKPAKKKLKFKKR